MIQNTKRHKQSTKAIDAEELHLSHICLVEENGKYKKSYTKMRKNKVGFHCIQMKKVLLLLFFLYTLFSIISYVFFKMEKKENDNTQ